MTDQFTSRKASARLTSEPARLERLKRRADFLRVASTRKKWATQGLILQIAPVETPLYILNSDNHQGRDNKKSLDANQTPLPRVGFTASKKVGGAIQRNRAKRRLRAIADEILPKEASRNCDYVLIGRTKTLDRSFNALKGDLRYALKKLEVRL